MTSQTGMPCPDNGPATTPRKNGRIRCQWTHCNLGDVLDIGAGGMRVRCRRRLIAPVNGQLSVIVEGLDGQFAVSARIAWKRRVGLFGWEIGLQLIEVSNGSRTKLAQMARAAIINGSFDEQCRSGTGGSGGLGLGGV